MVLVVLRVVENVPKDWNATVHWMCVENVLKNRVTYLSKTFNHTLVENELSKSIFFLSLSLKISFHSDCENRKGDVKCTGWKKNCTKKNWINYLKKNCKKTCNHCWAVYWSIKLQWKFRKLNHISNHISFTEMIYSVQLLKRKLR